MELYGECEYDKFREKYHNLQKKKKHIYLIYFSNLYFTNKIKCMKKFQHKIRNLSCLLSMIDNASLKNYSNKESSYPQSHFFFFNGYCLLYYCDVFASKDR